MNSNQDPSEENKTPKQDLPDSCKPLGGEETCFVIGRPRSGTTVLKKMLESHSRVFNMGEIFNEANPSSYFHFLQRLLADDPSAFFPGKSAENFQRYVRWCHEKARKELPDCSCVVMDVKYDQAHLLCPPWWSINSLPRLFSLIREQGWRVIDIHRDVVRMFVSNHVAMSTHIYHSSELGSLDQTQAKVRIDPQALLRDIAATSQVYEKISSHFRGYGKYLLVQYEEMFDGKRNGQFSETLLSRLSDFLNIDNSFDPNPQLAKLLLDDPFSHIENADEVRDALQRTSRLPQT